MAMNQSFIDALMQMRRKATIQGRPLTSAETAGVTEGMAASASDRLAKAKAAELGEGQLALGQESLALNRLNSERQLDIANKMMRQEKYKNYATTGLIGAGTAYQMLKPAATVASTVAPEMANYLYGGSQAAKEAPTYFKQISDIVSKWF